MSRRILALTTSRADWGIVRPVLRAIQKTPGLSLDLVVGGMHFSAAHGRTEALVRAEGFQPAATVEHLEPGDDPVSLAHSMGAGTTQYADVLARVNPDLILLVGDRFEVLAAGVAALPFNIPIAHLHGGELTEGVIDDAARHALTQLSHVHFVTTDHHARRVVQMGVEPWRVHMVGAPALDEVATHRQLSADEMEKRFHLDLSAPPLVVTFHPPTRRPEAAEAQTRQLVAALSDSGLPQVFTLPNADTAHRAVEGVIRRHVASRDDAWLVENFGTDAYYSLLRVARAMVGNSSSGIIEAASFGLPVVDVGDRQKGRERGRNVIQVEPRREAILAGIRSATTPSFRDALNGLTNPYGDGKAAQRIADALVALPERASLIAKHFHDVPGRP